MQVTLEDYIGGDAQPCLGKLIIGTANYEIEGLVLPDSISILSNRKLNPNSKRSFIKINNQGKVIRQYEQTRNIGFRDIPYNIRVSIIRGESIPELKNVDGSGLKYSKMDQKSFIWKGNHSLLKGDNNTSKFVREVLNFWPKGYTPKFLGVDIEESTGFGYCSGITKSILVINKYSEKDLISTNKFFEIRSGETWIGMENSTDDSYLIVGFTKNMNKLKENMVLENPLFIKAIEVKYGVLDQKAELLIAPRVVDSKNGIMRKIKGHDIFGVTARGSVTLIRFHNDSFENFLRIDNIYDGPIKEIVFSHHLMIVMPYGVNGIKKMLKFIKFDAETTYELLESDLSKIIAIGDKLNPSSFSDKYFRSLYMNYYNQPEMQVAYINEEVPFLSSIMYDSVSGLLYISGEKGLRSFEKDGEQKFGNLKMSSLSIFIE